MAGPRESGRTGDLSATGMFVITDAPVSERRWLELLLELAGPVPVEAARTVPMRGVVRWSRRTHQAGRSPGMGVQLVDPPPAYVEFVRGLY